MSAFRRFDPWAEIEVSECPAAKPAKPAKVVPPQASNFSRFSDFSRGVYAEADFCALPRAWAEGVARLRTMPVPPAFVGKDWPEPLLSDAERFLAEWGATAARLGWPDWALWGVQRRVPSSWHGRELVALLGGCPVVALTATEAVIAVRPGVNHTYRRPERDPLHPAERRLLWEMP